MIKIIKVLVNLILITTNNEFPRLLPISLFEKGIPRNPPPSYYYYSEKATYFALPKVFAALGIKKNQTYVSFHKLCMRIGTSKTCYDLLSI